MKFGKTYSRESGVALVVTLWALILVSILAAGVINSSRTARALAVNERERATAQAAADAGVNRALFMLLNSRSSVHWRADGSKHNFIIGDIDISLTVQDEGGKLDLNRGAPNLLLNLFVSTGLDTIQAQALLDCVMDWKDSNNLRRLNGAEDAEYLHANLGYSPRNSAFQSVSELGLVIGVSSVLLKRIEPALTVYSHSANIDATVAPFEALLALPEMTIERAEKILEDRLTQENGGKIFALQNESALAGRVFTIESVANLSDRYQYTRKAIVRISGNPLAPYWVYEWRELPANSALSE